jgi:hypothetical protein
MAIYPGTNRRGRVVVICNTSFWVRALIFLALGSSPVIWATFRRVNWQKWGFLESVEGVGGSAECSRGRILGGWERG